MKLFSKFVLAWGLYRLAQSGRAGAGIGVPAVELASPPLRNGRRVAAGYVLTGLQPQLQEGNDRASGAMAESFAADLAALGIRVLVSFQPATPEVDRALRARGIQRLHDLYPNTLHANYWNFHVWKDYDHDWTGPLLAAASRVGPRAIGLQCTHGVDRTGNACAFLLAVRQGWPIADAWYSVAARTQTTCDGIAEVLAELGHPDRRSPGDPSVGYNGYRGNGMHAHTNGFRDYLRWLIPKAVENGARWTL